MSTPPAGSQSRTKQNNQNQMIIHSIVRGDTFGPTHGTGPPDLCSARHISCSATIRGLRPRLPASPPATWRPHPRRTRTRARRDGASAGGGGMLGAPRCGRRRRRRRCCVSDGGAIALHGRRLRALQLPVARGKLCRAFVPSCRVVVARPSWSAALGRWGARAPPSRPRLRLPATIPYRHEPPPVLQ